MNTEEKRADKLNRTPTTPGVYLMKDVKGKVIYIGKAKNLKSRVRSYFGVTDGRPMIPFMVPKIADFEWVVTNTEKEALILENTLIKKFKPRYNVMLRDDKAYFCIRLDLKREFPRFELVRRIKRDKARYFGPYSSSAAVKKTLHFLHQLFPLRTCRDLEFKSRRRPCIEYEIKRCLAPCVGLVGSKEYNSILYAAVLFMEGREKKITSMLTQKMKEASNNLDFEEAARCRDRINAIEATLEKQRVVSSSQRDQDVFGLWRSNDKIQVYTIHVRKGIITGRRSFSLLRANAPMAEIISSLLKQYYDRGAAIPKDILVSEPLEESTVIEEWLTEAGGKKVSILVPKRGAGADLLSMAEDNARTAMMSEQRAAENTEDILKESALALQLKKVPGRIECFDISGLQGRYAVGSMVVFLDGKADTSLYRRFKIKAAPDAGDYGMMYEMLLRRFAGKEDLPDLIVIDGGKGQLGIALTVLSELGIKDVDAVGLAKESRLKSKKSSTKVRKDEDRIYLPGRKNPLYLSSTPSVLKLLQRIRDESHRFAIAYYRNIKLKDDFQSELDGVAGIGEWKKRALLSHFKSIQDIKEASLEEIASVSGIGPVIAARIKEYFSRSLQQRKGKENSGKEYNA
ncbi:MAG: excinuclease ABC subunit UvrC [Syntrophales bacterium]|nr:excinuclease ABC subunit UvrC [Syntrophales bacterium]MDY0043812.1 excinuclease ABC subunit UvrC [Syntrophales bacterium]